MKTATATASSVIIGYGNPLCGDDGVGCTVADVLANRYESDARVIVIAAHQLTPEMCADLADAHNIVFIDARVCIGDGDSAGVVQCQPIDVDSIINVSGHSVSPGALLSLTEQLYGRKADAILITVSGSQFDLGSAMSEDVRAQIPYILDLVESQIGM